MPSKRADDLIVKKTANKKLLRKPTKAQAALPSEPVDSTMNLTNPTCCHPHAFDALLEDVASIETTEGLVRAAFAVSLHQYPEGDVHEAIATIKQLAAEVRKRVKGTQPQAVLAHLHDYLFEELGFRGDDTATDQPGSSYLPHVLRARRGLPILLSLVYVAIARELGLNAWGVGLPGHFLAGVECNFARMLVDPYNRGRVLTEEDAAEKMRQIFGTEAEFLPEMLEPVSHRIWLTRLMQNLLRSFGSAGKFEEVGAMLELEMLLWPRQHQLQRDLALVLARLGKSAPAKAWLTNYLRNNPEDPQKVDLEQLLAALKV